MADKQVTVAVPEERVPEFYAWFASFLASEPGTPPPFGGRGRRGRRGIRRHDDVRDWSAEDAQEAAWLYRKLAPPARELFDVLADRPGGRIGGEQLARQLALEKGSHGVAGVLAWPGRYSRHLGRVLPIATEGRPDGGTDYYMEPEIAGLFKAARDRPRR
ncbi:MAG: hypothetical protein JOZ95_06380 [Solirubrobacterales bacterium]|nr:hypothetical protein [Solirubrobacterales bacterium]